MSWTTQVVGLVGTSAVLLTAVGVVRLATEFLETGDTERRARRVLDRAARRFELDEPAYGTLEGRVEGVDLRIRLYPDLGAPIDVRAHADHQLAFLVFLVALGLVPGLTPMCFLAAVFSSLAFLVQIGLGASARRAKAAVVRTQLEVRLPKLGDVRVERGPTQASFATGDRDFDAVFDIGGDRLRAMAVLRPEARAALLSLDDASVRDGALRVRLPLKPKAAQRRVRAALAVVGTLEARRNLAKALARRIREETEVLPGLQAVAALHRLPVDRRERVVRDVLQDGGVDPDDLDAVADAVARGDAVGLAAVGHLGVHGLPAHLAALDTMAATWPAAVSDARSHIRARVAPEALGGLDLADPEARGGLSTASRAGELTQVQNG
jgi:hypothetical protein